jgi:acyl-coenzyme A thioesterase PaaI-like protein
VTSDAGGQPYDADLMAAVAELGTVLRELVDASVLTTVPAGELRAAAAEARGAVARLTADRRPVNRMPLLDDPAAARRVYNPVTGVGSALAPPLTIRPTEDGVVAGATLGPAYEGPPGYVHGGVSSLLLDQVLAAAVLAAGLWGMTARLELAYHRPVPLRTPLTLRAQVTEHRGRRTTATGGIALVDDPDQPLVEARGQWVTPRAEVVADYFGAIPDASGQYGPAGRPADATTAGSGA